MTKNKNIFSKNDIPIKSAGRSSLKIKDFYLGLAGHEGAPQGVPPGVPPGGTSLVYPIQNQLQIHEKIILKSMLILILSLNEF